MASYFDEHGHLKPLTALTDSQVAAIASIEVVKKNLTDGDGQVEYIHKIKLWDKNRATELAMRHFGLVDGDGLPPVRKVPVFALPSDGPQMIAVY